MFNTEEEFVIALEKSLKRLDPGSGSFACAKEILREVNVGYGIADIVVARTGADCSIDSKTSLSEKEISILTIIQKNKQTTIENLHLKTRIPTAKIRKSLTILRDNEYIHIDGDTVTIANNYKPYLLYSIAIEAKLKSWGRALRQACRYKNFSEISFVCMPYKNIRPAAVNIEKFEKYNVGLMYLKENGNVEIIHAPTPETPYNEKMTILLNEIVKSMHCLHANS